MKLILGSNTIDDCDCALILGGVEVFRVRPGEGQWLCDFDVRAPDGSRLAKIAKNQAVHVAAGYTFQSSPQGARVLAADGSVVASALALNADTVEVTGQFYANGAFAKATATALTFQGSTMSRNYLSGCGSAFVLG